MVTVCIRFKRLISQYIRVSYVGSVRGGVVLKIFKQNTFDHVRLNCEPLGRSELHIFTSWKSPEKKRQKTI